MPSGTPLTPVRVLVVGPSARGGVSRLFDMVRTELARCPLGDIDLRCVTTRGKIPGSFGVVTSLWSFTVALVQQVVLMASGRVDVIHINLSSHGSTYRKLVVAAGAERFGVPYVIHVHGSAFGAFWASCSAPLARRIDRMFEAAARIIVMGASAHDLIVARLPACAPRIVVLRNATPRARPRKTDNGKLTHILFLGKLGRRKGVPELVEALNLLRGEPGWAATIAGDGALAETRSKVEHLGLAARIRVPGWLDHADVTSALENADVLVLPSHADNSPLAVIEAFAHGLAVVTTEVGAIPDLVEEGHSALFVRPGDAAGLADCLRQLIADPALRRRLGANAKEFHAKHLEIDTFVRRLADIWRAAAGRVERQ